MKRNMKKFLSILLVMAMTLLMLAGCSSNTSETKKEEGTTSAAEGTQGTDKTKDSTTGSNEETRIIVDATGAEVEVPAHPQKIAVAAMVLPNIVYALQGTAENMVSIPPAAYSGWEMSILKDLAPELEGVDTTMVNDDFTVNVEALAAAGVDLVLNWDSQTDQAEQLKALGIPVVLVSSAKSLEDLKSLISILGDALNCTDRTQKVLDWYDETLAYFDSKADQISALSEDKMPRVLHFQNVNQMTCYTGGMNVNITALEGGQSFTLPADVTEPTMELILDYDPEIIFISNFDDVTPDDFYNNKLEGQDWSNVSAVKNHQVYKVPCGLYRWAPPNTFEKPLYMLWTASIVQPEIFNDYDIRTEIREFYADYFGYELTDAQLDTILRSDLNK